MSSGSIWGIDIGGSTSVVGRLDGNRFSIISVIPTDPDRSPDSVLGDISDIILRADPAPRIIGAGVAGLVDRKKGILITSPNLPAWRGCHVAAVLESLIGAPVLVDNDCNTFAYGGISRGEIPSTGLYLLVTLGTGIGGTIILDGDIVYGQGHAGEFGHMTVNAGGIACPCGSTGCWERYAAKEALIRYYNTPGDSTDTRAITCAAENGDRKAVEAFTTFGCWVGTGLASLANCFNPAGFFLAGGLSCAFDLFEFAARSEFSIRCRSKWNVSVLDSATEAGARGAAFMAGKLSQ